MRASPGSRCARGRADSVGLPMPGRFRPRVHPGGARDQLFHGTFMLAACGFRERLHTSRERRRGGVHGVGGRMALVPSGSGGGSVRLPASGRDSTRGPALRSDIRRGSRFHQSRTVGRNATAAGVGAGHGWRAASGGACARDGVLKGGAGAARPGSSCRAPSAFLVYEAAPR